MKGSYILTFVVAIVVLVGILLGSKDKIQDTKRDLSDRMDSNVIEKAIFAGGCFWCMEYVFEHVDGVVEAVSGYTGGNVPNPTYDQVSTGRTGHYEAVQVYYNPGKVSYKELLEVFWMKINPTDPTGQFSDRGTQYKTAIFYHNKEQMRLAIQSKIDLEESNKFNSPIATQVLPSEIFYPAEEYHQDYYKKKSARYNTYKNLSGREGYIKEKWGSKDQDDELLSEQWEEYQKPSKEELKKRLTDLQFKVTQEDKTEPPFDNKYWDNKKDGIYVDVLSGEPLFSSNEKSESGTGWPSFYEALEPDNVIEKDDYSLGIKRIEVRSRYADSHLGHLFYDGPQPTGRRYCINSAALEFIPKDKLEETGYSDYTKLFN